jgi:hypothetical protein
VRKFCITLILALLCIFLWQRCSRVENPGSVVEPMHSHPMTPAEPEQAMLTTPQAPTRKNGWTLQPLAMFSLEARLLGVKFYKDDFTAILAPCDLALGWGQMADPAVLDRIHIMQEDRLYRWRFWGKAPIPEKEIITLSANMHIIPANESILKTLKSLHKGAMVRLSGKLVTATHPKASKPWASSLTREDQGKGACELFYVTSVTEH